MVNGRIMTQGQETEFANTAARDEARVATRTNICLLAVLKAGDSQQPVKVRNLSTSGALVDGGALPPAGADVNLLRGSLGISGKVVWSENGRCGVMFAERVRVKDWLAKGGVHQDQNRTDKLIAQIRKGEAAVPQLRPQPRKRFGLGIIEGRLADEIAYVIRLLESLGDDLANDRLLVARHAASVQGIDLAGQILGHVARVLLAEDKAAAAESIGMESMRARLLRKSL